MERNDFVCRWVEEDAKEILATCYECFERVVENLRNMNIDPANIKAVGIANQRETTVVWDRITGEPLHPAISKTPSTNLACLAP